MMGVLNPLELLFFFFFPLGGWRKHMKINISTAISEGIFTEPLKRV